MSHPSREVNASDRPQPESDVCIERQVRRVCEDFSRNWYAGKYPRIEDYVIHAPHSMRQRILAQLICTELDLCATARLPTRAAQYYERFPADRAIVEAALSAASDLTHFTPRAELPRAASDPTLDSTDALARSPIDASHDTPVDKQSPDDPRVQNRQNADPVSEVATVSFDGTCTTSQLPGYELMERLGEGGMGTVWRARQLSTNRMVAVKFVRGLESQPEAARERFKREVQLAASLQHPHIARVYDSGLDRGQFFYAMELVDGVPLDAFVHTRRSSMIEISQLVAAVCEAVQYAHRHGIVHRDLKPSNVLVSATGAISVVDFGLAMNLGDTGSQITSFGELLGTPAYMSPEQAGGFAHDVDERSDVFSLGVVLYKLLTGHVPFHGTRDAVISQVLHDTPPPPTRLRREIPPDLEAICLKAMQKEPSRRYANCAELANDLRRFLRGDAVQAKRRSVLHSALRFCEHVNRIRDAGSLTVGLASAFIVWHIAVATFTGASFWVAKSRADAVLPLMAFYIIAWDVPYIYLGLNILKRSRITIVATLMFDAILVFLAAVFVVFPESFPLKDVHATNHHVQTNWFLIGTVVLFGAATHALALIAHNCNRQLIEWQQSAVDASREDSSA